MSKPPKFLTDRLKEYDELVEEHKAELERIRAKRDAFREVLDVWQDHTSTNGLEASSETDGDDSEGGNGNGPTIRDTVVAVLRDAGKPLTRNEIVERAAEMGHKVPKNSVRWDTYHGTDDGVYEKLDPKEGSRAKRYKLAE